MSNFINKIHRSYAFRSGSIYRRLATWQKIPKQSIKPVEPELLFVSMVGVEHIDYLSYCLLSLYENWPRLPIVRIVSDGTIGDDQIFERIEWWPGPIKITSVEHCLPKDVDNYPALNSYFHTHPLGKKLAVIICCAANQLTLWSDVDVLWRGSLIDECLDRGQASVDVLHLATDYQFAYDENIEGAKELVSKGVLLNTGVVLARGSILDLARANYLLEMADSYGVSHFTEQTILALAGYEKGGMPWTQRQIYCDASDNYRIVPDLSAKSYIARHYVGPVRHLFWLDAFFSRNLNLL